MDSEKGKREQERYKGLVEDLDTTEKKYLQQIEEERQKFKNDALQLQGKIFGRTDLRVSYTIDKRESENPNLLYLFQKLQEKFPHINFVKDPDCPIGIYLCYSSTARIHAAVDTSMLQSFYDSPFSTKKKILILETKLILVASAINYGENMPITMSDKDIKAGIKEIILFAVKDKKWSFTGDEEYNNRMVKKLAENLPERPLGWMSLME